MDLYKLKTVIDKYTKPTETALQVKEKGIQNKFCDFCFLVVI